MALVAIPINDETWLICGGRDFSDREMFKTAMNDLVCLRGVPEIVVHGGARGADSLADEWATRLGVKICRYDADWKTHGLAAGPIRNQQMLDKERPSLVIAFPGGRGTADMVERARKAKIVVAEIVRTALAQGER